MNAQQIVETLLGEFYHGSPRYKGPNQRATQILKMRDEQGLSFDKIAAQLGISKVRVRQIYMSTKHYLGQALPFRR